MASIGSALSFEISTGVEFHEAATVTAIPGSAVTIFSFTVPSGTTRKINDLVVVSSSPGDFSLEAGGSEIARGILYEAEKNVRFKFGTPRPIAGGTLVELIFTAESEPTTGCPVSGFLSANDFI